MRVRHLIPIAAALASIAAAAPAGAATLTTEGGTLVYRAAPGETNYPNLYPDDNAPGNITIGDSSNTITVSTPDCVDEEYGVSCQKPAKLRLELGDGTDGASFGSSFPTTFPIEIDAGDGNDNFLGSIANYKGNGLTIDGGAGSDDIYTGDGNDTIRGGAGNDQIKTSGGNDHIEAGDGDDYIRPDYYADPAGSDYIDGGGGTDKVDDWVWPEVEKPHPPISITLDGVANDGRPGEYDNVLNVESYSTSVSGNFVLSDGADIVDTYSESDQGNSTIVGKGGNDKLTGHNYVETIDGGPGDDRLEGGYNNDTITGGPGRDMIYGDSTASQCGFLQSCTVPFGNDTINARDGEADVIDCGIGEDKAVVDAIDTVANCETVDKSGATPPDNGQQGPGDNGQQNGPGTALTASIGKIKLKKALSGGLPVTVNAPAAGKVKVTVKNGKKSVASASKTVTAGTNAVKATFTKAAKKSLGRVKKAALKVTVTFTPNGGGAKQTITAKSTLR